MGSLSLSVDDVLVCNRLFQLGLATFAEARQQLIAKKLSMGWLPPRRTIVGYPAGCWNSLHWKAAGT